MAIHIGEIIKNALKAKNIDVTEFAKKISYTRGNAYKIFKKKSIDTDLLVSINKVLDQNLFLLYVPDKDIAQHKAKKTTNEELMQTVEQLKMIDSELDTKLHKGGKSIKKKK